MVRSLLVDSEIAASRELLCVLDKAEFPVVAAFWQREDDSEGWYLYLASPLVGTADRQELYNRLRHVLADAGLPLDLTQIKLVDPKRLPRKQEGGGKQSTVPFSTSFDAGFARAWAETRVLRAPRHPVAPFPEGSFALLDQAIEAIERDGELEGARRTLARLSNLIRNFDSNGYPMDSLRRVDDAARSTTAEDALVRLKGLRFAWNLFWSMGDSTKVG